MTTKPLVATTIVLGYYHAPGFNGTEPTLFGQVRGFYNPKTGDKLKGSPGERSLFGEHYKPTEDADIVDTAVRCAHREYWLPSNDTLGRADFTLLKENIETDNSINTLFFLNRIALPHQIGNGEGDGLLHIPLSQVSWYIRDGVITEASIKTLAACDLSYLWHQLTGED
ncbi:MAG: hypothetical protein DI628_04715 [Blastochloris viridis]|uniref:Uncharacterized protein n=1 Tax=Blastochloris viridis TaxID=1079 RepID=A0A6N4RFI2_BLAVI|nr:MAG: hypothetical protein DI628_04715 [Blastochloris viridis]